MSLATATSSSPNAVVASSRAHRSAGPTRIQFGPDWRNNEIMNWHHSLGRRATKINMFQLRRERSAFKHQYVVLILSDECILRLDRRGDETKPVDTLTLEGTESIDTIADVTSLPDLDKTSDCLAKLHCQGSNVDLLNIIKICFGIHRDTKAGRYTLQCFNCYFFAWTLLIATARHILRWDMLPPDSSWETISQTLADALSTKTADVMINLMIKGTVITAITTRLKLKSQLSRTMSRRARLTWAMPEWLIRLALRVMLRSSGKSGIHSSLLSRLRSEVRSTLQPTLNSVLTDLRASTLRTTLWKEDVGDAVRDAAYRDVTTGILNAITAAVSSIKLTMEDVDAFRSLAGTFGDPDFLGGRTADWRPAIIAGFGAMMKAAPLFAAPEARVITDDTTWDELWNSMRDIVRNASKEAMKDAEGGWTELWDTFMEVWAAAWETLRTEIRDACRITLKELTDLTNNALVYSVIKTLPDSHLQIDVRDTGSRLRHMSRSKFIPGLADITQFELQPYMLKLIRDHGRVMGRYRLGSPIQVEKDIREAMDRVWRAVVDLDGGDASGRGDHKADVS
ncbi:hypothetical protein BS47DRAFT_1489826 [Hydnum rufescens UP504]|uniref:Uncharacterized protein n=1 Tax=Hydnum rufescens UP504 TaxID=1448309 RepID=A0A9P6AGH9_9AGAM|nr:hypothetical protein BS47DRAFT_1489826 [Hydnum rufescens UP504]